MWCGITHIPHFTLQWRQVQCDGVSNHQLHDCLLNHLFRRRSNKTSKLRVTGLCAGNSPVTCDSPHKWPETRKLFPFDDVIMKYPLSYNKTDQIVECRCACKATCQSQIYKIIFVFPTVTYEQIKQTAVQSTGYRLEIMRSKSLSQIAVLAYANQRLWMK